MRYRRAPAQTPWPLHAGSNAGPKLKVQQYQLGAMAIAIVGDTMWKKKTKSDIVITPYP